MTHENPTDGSNRGIGAVLRDLLESIAEAEEEKRTHGQGHSPVGRGRIGYEFSIGLGTLDSVGEDRNRSERERWRVRETDTDIEANDYVASVSEVDGEKIVVVDLPGVDPETLSAGVNDRTATLTIADDTGIIERVPLPQGELTIADASFNNAILELRLMEGDE